MEFIHSTQVFRKECRISLIWLKRLTDTTSHNKSYFTFKTKKLCVALNWTFSKFVTNITLSKYICCISLERSNFLVSLTDIEIISTDDTKKDIKDVRRNKSRKSAQESDVIRAEFSSDCFVSFILIVFSFWGIRKGQTWQNCKSFSA